MKQRLINLVVFTVCLLAPGGILTGCGNPFNPGGVEGFDSALVATWHSTQAAADNGQYAVFEFTADGELTGEAFTAGVVNWPSKACRTKKRIQPRYAQCVIF